MQALDLQDTFESSSINPPSWKAMIEQARTYKVRETVPLRLPRERYKPDGEEPVLEFLDRVWGPLFRRGEDVWLDTIKDIDPKAYKAIPWPSAKYKHEKNEGTVNNVVEFLEKHWQKLIRIGFVERSLLNKIDVSVYWAVTSYEQKPKPGKSKPKPSESRRLPSHVAIPTRSQRLRAIFEHSQREARPQGSRISAAKYRHKVALQAGAAVK